MKQVHFPGLNGIRFIAAFLVILDHTELMKGYLGLPPFWSETFSAHLGSTGVTIFFVLSGFLITYLLLMEKHLGPIHIRSFYFRRVLRIWPLYYLIFVLGFFIIPLLPLFQVPGYSIPFDTFPWDSFWTYGSLLANVGFIYCVPIAYAGILWSVAVEEQFYLIWPWIVQHFSLSIRKLFVIVLVYFFLKILAYFPALGIKDFLPDHFYFWLDRTRISCMIIGGIGALCLYQQKWSWLNFIYSKTHQWIQFGIFLLILSNLLNSSLFHLVKNEILAINVMIIIVNIASNGKSLLTMENRVFDFLGKISYGLYVYHLLVAVVVIKFMMSMTLFSQMPYWVSGILILFFTTLISIVISHLSYRYFEKYFLKKKERFSVIKTS
jgi:peptidoglycan/LPS O-acetylase OafA/YrhL